ncbi:MAG: serine protease [Planctomycetes bacterium]|nr:serine protease [Planctomycetota bacterium]
MLSNGCQQRSQRGRGTAHQSPERQRGAMHHNPKCTPEAETQRGSVTIFMTVLAALTVLLHTASELQAQARVPQEAEFQKLLADKTPPIVTIKFVLKIKSSWGESESESEATAVIVEPDGLILCSKTELGGYGGYFGGSSTSMPTDIKVLIGDDTEGLEAKLLARDSELDLIWLRIESPGDGKFTYVDLHKSAVPEIGDHIYSVSRMGKYFDRIAVVSEARVGGVTVKPRRLYVPSGPSGGLGLPVYNSRGELIGIPIRLRPNRDELEGASEMYGGWGLILPAEEIAKATQRAKEAGEQDEEEDREADDDRGDD